MDFTEFQFDAVLPSTALQVDVYNMAARAVVMVISRHFSHLLSCFTLRLPFQDTGLINELLANLLRIHLIRYL